MSIKVLVIILGRCYQRGKIIVNCSIGGVNHTILMKISTSELIELEVFIAISRGAFVGVVAKLGGKCKRDILILLFLKRDLKDSQKFSTFALILLGSVVCSERSRAVYCS